MQEISIDDERSDFKRNENCFDKHSFSLLALVFAKLRHRIDSAAFVFTYALRAPSKELDPVGFFEHVIIIFSSPLFKRISLVLIPLRTIFLFKVSS